VTTSDIGTSGGWVEAKGTSTVRHVLNRTQQSDRSIKQLGVPNEHLEGCQHKPD